MCTILKHQATLRTACCYRGITMVLLHKGCSGAGTWADLLISIHLDSGRNRCFSFSFTQTPTQPSDNNKPRSDPRRYRSIRTRFFCEPARPSVRPGLSHGPLLMKLSIYYWWAVTVPVSLSSSKMVSPLGERMRVYAPALWNYVRQYVTISGAEHQKRAFLYLYKYLI